MKNKYLFGLTVVPIIALTSAIAHAENIDIQTRNIDIYRRNGSIYIDTGRVRVNSSPSRFPYRRRPDLRLNQLRCARQHTIRQSSRQYHSFSQSSQQTIVSKCY